MNIKFAAHFLKYARSLRPPGSCGAFLEHPVPASRRELAVPVGIVTEHRFAFAHWIHCKQLLMYDKRAKRRLRDDQFNPPDLISFDWHDDFGCDSDFNRSDLEILNQRDEDEVSLFCWAALRSLNDGHIKPAVWLNALGNVYIVQKQYADFERRSQIVEDRYGNPHSVNFVPSLQALADAFEETGSGTGVIWDVDLDYFVEPNKRDDSKPPSLLSKRQLRAILSPRSRWMKQIFGGLRAITIALEPRYTGGLAQSLELYRRWENILFDASIFDHECRWRDNPFE